jgi:ATP-binding cassette subfamily B protein
MPAPAPGEAGSESSNPARHKTSVKLALQFYGREILRSRRFAFPALLLPALGNVLLFYVGPLLVAAAIGHIAAGSTAVLGYVLGYFAVCLLAEGIWRVGVHCLNRADARGIEQLNLVGMDALLAKDAAFFHGNYAGSLTKRVLGFASRYEEFIDTLSFSVVANIVPLIFASVVLGIYNPILVVVLIGMIALTGLVVAPLIRRRQKLVDEREAAYARVSGHVADSLSNMDTVRAFGAQEKEAAEHRSRVADSRRLALRSWDYSNLRIDTIIAPMSVLTNSLGLLVAVVWAGGLGVQGTIVAFTYFGNATRIMFDFNQVYRRLESSLTEAAQFTELLLESPTVVDPAAPEPLRNTGADVRFCDVTFGYAGAPPLFRGLDLDVPSGTKLGLVGRSGGGKSTLTRLLLRFMDVDQGRILIGGQDITALRQADLRSLFAYVPQDPAMFHRTLRENIAFARPNATEKEIRQAAEAAHVTEFADTLPEGFDTLVGERGVKLSGGQRQRVALARAILRNAPILLLDEATSALDSESESLVQDALWHLMQDRTAFVIAHRLSTVANMDRLVVLDQGTIVEQGSHTELLAHDGTYAKLWHHQSGGFLDGEGETDGEKAVEGEVRVPGMRR